MLYSVCGFAGTNPLAVILEGQVRSSADGGKLSAVLPSKGVVDPVEVGQRVADGIVGVTHSAGRVQTLPAPLI